MRFSDWLFNVKNQTWIYNPASLCLDPPEEEDLQPLFYPPPLCQETLRHLDIPGVTALVEENFGDVLFLIASFSARWETDLSYYARHGLLTLGTVVNRWKPEILTHLPSSPSPEWFSRSYNPNVKTNFSSSVPGRVDFSFQKTGHVKVEFDLGWHIPEKDQDQLQCTFLCQSLRFVDDCDDVKRVIYVNQVGFSLQGTFLNDPTNRSTPVYLFVHPLPIDFINNLYCIRYPLPEKLFYWSYDPQGRNAITAEDRERFEVPELSMERWIGTFWKEEHYAFVQEHLCSRSYNLDGKKYAYDHGHPKLVFADPHNTATIEEWKFSDLEPELSPSPSLASSSGSSLHGQAFEEPNIRLISPLPRRDVFVTEPGISPLNYASAPHINHSWERYTGYGVPYDSANGPASRSLPHSMNTETPGIHPQYLTMADSFNPTTASQQNFTNRNHVPLTATNNFPSSLSLSDHVPFRNMRAISRPIDRPAEFAMCDRDALSVPYPGVGQDVTTTPPFFHAGNMQSTGMEPQHETTVDSTLSQRNVRGSSDTLHNDNAYNSPFLPNLVYSLGIPQLAATNLYRRTHTANDSPRYYMPSAVSYPSMAQDTFEPSGQASYAPYRGGGRIPEQYCDVAPQIYQAPSIHHNRPHRSLDGGRSQVPQSAYSARNQYGGEKWRRRGS
ncbi:hypothetical protein PQX77_016719 [Marasmius sp. AFHP31]|nr:hypothetical protein PQX77_016719 [Marasmius sp. AFHP31]